MGIVRMRIFKRWQRVMFSVALGAIYTGTAVADTTDWSMTLSPQSTNAYSGKTVDFAITFINNSTQDIFFSDFGDGQGITVDLQGMVIGNGVCGAGVDCFVQNLFLTSLDPIDIVAGSTATFDLGVLQLGAHSAGDEITVLAKGGPDSLPSGAFPNPAFAETTALVQIAPVPEPSPIVPLLVITGWLTIASRRLRGR